ncbi:transcriptional regulator, XRE family [Leptolyngbya sp. NIES-3755]|nr:transcriptional regulator, XRE family [Leptolyngbya sp. NIES-3755]
MQSSRSLPKSTLALKQAEVIPFIRELRQLTGLTQEQLADALGLSFATVNRWENGHMQPSKLALRQIRSLLQELTASAEVETQKRSQALLDRYFSVEV